MEGCSPGHTRPWPASNYAFLLFEYGPPGRSSPPCVSVSGFYNLKIPFLSSNPLMVSGGLPNRPDFGDIGGYRRFAGVAQLVEHNVANVVVVGSNPITRS